MRILAVLAHPHKESHNGTLFSASVQHLQARGHEVDVLDLYEHADKIPFYPKQLPGQHIDQALAHAPFYQENKARFMAADRLLVVYPVWWYSVPGILKCWLDIITNYAWSFKDRSWRHGFNAHPLHKITKVLVVNTGGLSWWHQIFGPRNLAIKTLRASCAFMGIKAFKAHTLYSTRKLTPEQFNKHLQAVLKKCDWLAS